MWLRVFVVAVFIVSLFTLIGCTAIAYGKREDRGFWGGANILNGWWLLIPYGPDGIRPGNDALVKRARIAFVGCLGSLIVGWAFLE